jgi:hypothetical protein
MQNLPDVVRVISDAELLLYQGGDPLRGPEIDLEEHVPEASN